MSSHQHYHNFEKMRAGFLLKVVFCLLSSKCTPALGTERLFVSFHWIQKMSSMWINPLKIETETGVDGDVSSLKSRRQQSWTLRDCKVLEVASQRCQWSKLLEAQVVLRYNVKCVKVKHMHVVGRAGESQRQWYQVPGTRYSPALPARVPSTDQGWGLTGRTHWQHSSTVHGENPLRPKVCMRTPLREEFLLVRQQCTAVLVTIVVELMLLIA